VSARRWPYYDLKVGEWFVVEKPPKRFAAHVRRYGYENGKVFQVRQQPNGWIKVRRMA
jgi:hypothetical protein